MDNNKHSENLILIRQVFWFFSCWFGGAILAALLVQLISNALGIGNLQQLIGKIREGQFTEHINSVKIISLAGHFASYTVPALAFAYLLKNRDFYKLLQLHKNPGVISPILIIVIMVSVYPAALWLAYFNINLLPAQIVAEDTLIFEQRLMQMNSTADLILNILLLGVVAGIGEELLFRGIIQRFAAQYSKNLHLAVWATALIFSIIHFQPEGFVPRFLMGALLGYLMVWTGSIWSAIIGHITFNSVQVLIFYYFVDVSKLGSVYQKPDFSPLFSILLLGIFIFACFVLWKINRKNTLSIAPIE